MGKSIGGTLGTPFEGRREIQNVTGYTHPRGEPLPNDDLDLQLVWLMAFQNRGPKGINSQVLGEYWLNFIPPHWNEYGINKANQRAGLLPPLSGQYRNERWKHSNGAWIRSEIWACLAPGCPDVALRFAYEDASVDHGGGEGTFAELFTAAVESAAFVERDRDALIRIGLSKIPPDCRVARSIGIVLEAYKKGLSWQEAREKVVADSADLGWFQAPANVAFVIVGWLYGEGDFGKSICTAVNCGDDTDCTGATLGSILGILMGLDGIPKEWIEPIGERIVTIAIDRGSMWGRLPNDVSVLTDMVMSQVPVMMGSFPGGVEIADKPTDLSGVPDLKLDDNGTARSLWSRSPYAVTFDFVHTRVEVDYQRDPDIAAGKPFPMTVTLYNQMPDIRHMDLIWHLPQGWAVTPSEASHVVLDHWPPERKVTVEITANRVDKGVNRGILEIVAPGRPTVGLIPLVFMSA
jgi:ADP-ribosylglycohydrolase